MMSLHSYGLGCVILGAHSLRHFDFLQQHTFCCCPGAALPAAGAAAAVAETGADLLACAFGAATGVAALVFFCDLLRKPTRKMPSDSGSRRMCGRSWRGCRAYRVQLGAAAEGFVNPVVLTLLVSGSSSKTTRPVMSNLGPLACSRWVGCLGVST
jgi:hypothetical protein